MTGLSIDLDELTIDDIADSTTRSLINNVSHSVTDCYNCNIMSANPGLNVWPVHFISMCLQH